MKLLLEELAPGRWQVEMLPTNQEELDKGMPTEIDIAAILLGISHDLVNKIATEGKEEEPAGRLVLLSPLEASEIARDPKNRPAGGAG